MSDPSASNLVEKDARVRACWAEFCSRHGVPEETPYQAFYFGDGPKLAHELVELVVYGPKRATTGLQWSIDRNPDLAPVPNGYSVITEYDGTPRGVIRTTQIEERAFRDVDAQYAWDEGEGDRSLKDWAGRSALDYATAPEIRKLLGAR